MCRGVSRKRKEGIVVHSRSDRAGRMYLYRAKLEQGTIHLALSIEEDEVICLL